MGTVQGEILVLLHALTVDVQPLDSPIVVARAQLQLCAELIRAMEEEGSRFSPRVVCVARVVDVSTINLLAILKERGRVRLELEPLRQVFYVVCLFLEFAPYGGRNSFAVVNHAARQCPLPSFGCE